jgi:hypothetical protein
VRRFVASLTLGLTLLVGCSSPTEPPPSPAPETAPIGSRFKPDDCGRIVGTVFWKGPRPRVPDYTAPLSPRAESGRPPGQRVFPNPGAPQIQDGRFLTNAVVLLRGVDPERSRPWDQPPVRVEIKDHRMLIHQGEVVSAYGFVRRGQSVELVSRDSDFHSIQARGTGFFTIPFADPDVVRQRRLTRQGVVELASASGSFWMAGHLFVDDHPYYARTENRGQFTLNDVPSGTYQLAAWLPDWREVERELDGDTWEVASIQYRPPLTVEQTIQVVAGKTCAVDLTFTAEK